MKHTKSEISYFENEISKLSAEQLGAATRPENILPNHKYVREPDNHSEAEKSDMRAKFEKVEQELLNEGITVKINNFSEMEGATQMLNKINHDNNYK